MRSRRARALIGRVVRIAAPCGALMLAGIAAAVAQSTILGTVDPTTGVLVPAATAPATSAPVQLGGTFVIKGSVAIGSNIVSDTTLTAFAQVSTKDKTYGNYSYIRGKLSRSGNKGTVTLEIPYLWTLTSATEQVTVLFTVSADTSNIDYSFQQTVTMAMPKNGSTTTVTFTGGL